MDEPRRYSKEYFLARLGPEIMADIEASVAAAPPPSPELIATIRRLFAVAPPTPTTRAASQVRRARRTTE